MGDTGKGGDATQPLMCAELLGFALGVVLVSAIG